MQHKSKRMFSSVCSKRSVLPSAKEYQQGALICDEQAHAVFPRYIYNNKKEAVP